MLQERRRRTSAERRVGEDDDAELSGSCEDAALLKIGSRASVSTVMGKSGGLLLAQSSTLVIRRSPRDQESKASL
jgi:hypothetical protein